MEICEKHQIIQVIKYKSWKMLIVEQKHKHCL